MSVVWLYTSGLSQTVERADEKRFSEECILDIIQGERELLPRIGTRKLYHLLHYKGINIGRDKLYKLLRDNDLLVRPSKRIVIRTTQASRRAYLFVIW